MSGVCVWKRDNERETNTQQRLDSPHLHNRLKELVLTVRRLNHSMNLSQVICIKIPLPFNQGDVSTCAIKYFKYF